MIDVGIVMPVYKQKPEYLKAALESVLFQNYKNFTLIVVIDGAPEMTDIVKEVINENPCAQIVINETNQGVSKALNRGFEVLFQDPNIKYLTWVSSDNIYYPNFIEILRSNLHNTDENVGLVYSSFNSIDENGDFYKSQEELAALKEYQAQSKEALLDSSIIGVSFMYKTVYAKQIEGYCLEPVEDYEYWLRLTQNCEILYIPEELMEYRVNSEFSISSSLQTLEKHRLWRYSYHLARYQARIRLNILPQVTVLFPVKEAKSELIDRIENLYEQTFSNYLLYVLDLSLDQSVKNEVSNISHPCTDVKWLSNIDEETAVISAFHEVETPLVLLLDQEFFPNPFELQTLVNQMKHAEESIISCSFNETHDLVGYRLNQTQPKLFPNELYRTLKIKEILRETDKKIEES